MVRRSPTGHDTTSWWWSGWAAGTRAWRTPPGGRQLLTRVEFRERYGGVLIRLVPTPEFAPRRVAWRDALLGRYLREFVAIPGSRRLLGGIVAGAALLQALGLAVPLATRFAVDRVIPQAQQDLLPLLAVGCWAPPPSSAC